MNNLNNITREKWLRNAVESLDTKLFNGDLKLYEHKYQVSVGRCPGQKKSETVFPFDGENVNGDDFFNVTMQISWEIKDPIEMLAHLAYECIHAFFDEKKNTKRFKMFAGKYYFDKPYTKCNITPHLRDILEDVYKEIGPFPGDPITFHPKPKKEGPKTTLIIFCPSCGMEYKVNRKTFEKSNSGLPTCGCGTKMGVDLSDETENGEDTTAQN